MASDLTQTRQQGQDPETLVLYVIQLGNRVGFSNRGHSNLFINGTFRRRQFHDQIHLGSSRQVLEYLSLGPSQNKRCQTCAKRLAPIIVIFLFDWRCKAIAELIPATQHTWRHDMKETPQFAQVIFDRGTSQRNCPLGRNGRYGHGCLASAIFDRLRFVQYQRRPFDLCQFFDIA